ncbi:MAG: S8 family serine peptidase, partial [Candidatus Pelagibacterales bacterium]
DGSKILNSSPCGETGVNCLAQDGYNITAGAVRFPTAPFDGSWYTSMNGTSMATPQVSGAVALLWEAFPDNSPEVITKRLLLTADNSWFSTNVCLEDSNSDNIFSSGDSFTASCGGTTGTLTFNGISHEYSSLYGHGTPDIYAALQPIGTKSVSFGNQAYALIGTGLLLANNYGDSLSMIGETGLYRDQLMGGFKFNLSELVSRNTRNEVQRKLQNGNHSVWSPVSNDQGLNFSYSHEADINNNGLVDDSGFYSSFVSGKNTIYVGQKYSIDQALGLRDGNNAMSVLTAHNSNESFLSFTESASSGNLIGSKIDLDNSLSFNVMAYNGTHSDYDLKEKGFLASLKHKPTSNSDFSIFIGQNNEMEGLLRTSGQGAFGNFAGETYHLGTTFNKQIANNVHIAGLFNYGLVTSSSDDAGFLSDVSDLKTSQFNLGMVVSGLGRSNNLMSLNLSQPLRVESGFTNLNIPGRLDQNGNVTHTTKRLSLEPSGRELNIDLGYEMKLFNGALKVGSQLMFDAVHMESNNSETVYGIFKTSF